MLKQLDENLWITEYPHKMMGIHFGARTTIVRLDNGDLWVHSPIAPSQELKQQIDVLGPVKYIVAPNLLHHVYAGDFHDAYPEAKLYGAPGLKKKRKKLKFHAELKNQAPEAWGAELDQVFVGGMPMINEVAFFHKASRTLICCDLMLNIPKGRGFLTAMTFMMGGVYGRLGVSRMFRFMMFGKKKARVAFKRIMAWDFDRMIFSHGEFPETGAKVLFKNAYRWLVP